MEKEMQDQFEKEEMARRARLLSTNSIGISSGGDLQMAEKEEEIEYKEEKDFAFAESIANSMGNFSLTPSKNAEKSPSEGAKPKEPAA